eukprot:3114108-Amphidinium_carterae.1
MKVNLKKTVVICNGANAKRLLMKVWRAGRLLPPRVTTRDLGVYTQWAAWRCPVQRSPLNNQLIACGRLAYRPPAKRGLLNHSTASVFMALRWDTGRHVCLANE